MLRAKGRPRRPLRDWAIAGEAYVRLLAACAALRVRPVQRVAASLSRHGQHVPTEAELARLAWAVDAAAQRMPIRPTCLRRAFAAAWMLQARGGVARVHYGVAKAPGGGYRSHAWAEAGGLPFIGHREAPGFALLTTLPPDEPNTLRRGRQAKRGALSGRD